MRRQIIILLTLLFIALPVLAQWPDELAGLQVAMQEPQEIQMYLEEMNDKNPWGMITPVGRFFYFGSLLFDECEGENVAVLQLSEFASRFCAENYWNPLIPGTCYYWMPREIQLTYTLPWDEDAKAYIVEGNGHWGVNILVLTMKNDLGIFQMGVMQLVDDKMVWDENYTWYKYVIEMRTAEQKMPRPRRDSRLVR